MFKYVAVLLLALSPLTFAITKYEQCKGNGKGLRPDWVIIEGCDEAPCDLYEGDILPASTGFIARMYFLSSKVDFLELNFSFTP